MMTLKEVPIGSTVTIKKVCATGPLKRRIVDMGLTKGTPVTVRSCLLYTSDAADE